MTLIFVNWRQVVTSWTDLLQALAAKRPEVTMVPPTLKYENLWDQQKRIEVLEAEVKHLYRVLAEILKRLDETEES
jgi:hypothetical protein